MIRNLAADRRDTDDRRADARLHGFCDAHFGQAEIDRTAREAHLAGAMLRPPIGEAEARFGVVVIGHIAEIEQVRRFEINRSERHAADYGRKIVAGCSSISLMHWTIAAAS